jgi:hypothetical protein
MGMLEIQFKEDYERSTDMKSKSIITITVILLALCIISCGNAQGLEFGDGDTLRTSWPDQYKAYDGTMHDWEYPVLWKLEVFQGGNLITDIDSLPHSTFHFDFYPTIMEDVKVVHYPLWNGFYGPPSDTLVYTYNYLKRKRSVIQGNVLPVAF